MQGGDGGAASEGPSRLHFLKKSAAMMHPMVE